MTANQKSRTGMKAMLLALGVGILGLATVANAAVVITTVGDGAGYDEVNVEAFRSTDVDKAFDVSGDNVYGTEGLFFFGNGLPNDGGGNPYSCHTQVGASWAAFSAGANFASVAEGGTFSYGIIDDPSLPAGPGVANWGIRSAGGVATTPAGAGSWCEILTFDIDATTPSRFRIGLMGSNLNNVNWNSSGYRISVDGGAAVTVASLPGTVGQRNFVFFDVDLNGETSGTFSIEGQRRAATQGASLAGVTFDVLPDIVITAVGNGTGYDETGVVAFRSTSVGKGFDGDGNDEYGTAGTFFFGTGATAGNGQPWSVHTQTDASWATFAAGAQFASVSEQTAYGPYDNPTLSGATVADWTICAIGVAEGGGVGNWAEVLTFTIDSSTPQKFRVGIMSGTQTASDGRWDPTGLRMSVNSCAATTVTGLPNTSGNTAGWAFFDVELNGETNGTFSIEGQNRLATQGTAISGVTFDVLPDIVITAVGDGTGYDETGVAHFRSMSVGSKGFDIDSDNAYGTEGLFFFGDGLPNDGSGNSFTTHTKVGASWATFSEGADFANVAEGGTFSYPIIDDPSLPIASDVANWGIRSALATTVWESGYKQVVTFDIDDTAPELFRIGIMAGNANNVIWNPVAIRLSVPGEAAQVTDLSPAIQQTNWVFFNVAVRNGATATFSVETSRNEAGTLRGGSIAGITFEKPTQGTLFMFH